MQWYLKVVRDNYANFKGRASRQEFWMFALFNFIFLMATAAIMYLVLMAMGAVPFTINPVMAWSYFSETSNSFDFWDWPFLYKAIFSIDDIYILAVLIPSIAVVVRRLHDVGKSGWFLLIALIPLVGTIWLFILYCTRGNEGENTYGPSVS